MGDIMLRGTASLDCEVQISISSLLPYPLFPALMPSIFSLSDLTWTDRFQTSGDTKITFHF